MKGFGEDVGDCRRPGSAPLSSSVYRFVSPEVCLQPIGHCSMLNSTLSVSAHWEGDCQVDGGVLERWKAYTTRGRLNCELLLFKCRSCGAVYGGPGCWPRDDCAARPRFPEGAHNLRGASSLRRLNEACRFCAVPEICFETEF